VKRKKNVKRPKAKPAANTATSKRAKANRRKSTKVRVGRSYEVNVSETASVSDKLDVNARDVNGTTFSESSTTSTAEGTLGSGVNLRTGTYHRLGESEGAPVSTEASEVRAGATIAAALSAETGVQWTSTWIGEDGQNGGDGDVKLEAPGRNSQGVEVTHVDTTAARLLNRDGAIDPANRTIGLAELAALVHAALERKGPTKYAADVRKALYLALFLPLPTGNELIVDTMRAAVIGAAPRYREYREVWLATLDRAFRLVPQV
jgi:hypothetical protein